MNDNEQRKKKPWQTTGDLILERSRPEKFCNLPVFFFLYSHLSLQIPSSPVLTTILKMKRFAQHAFGFISQKENDTVVCFCDEAKRHVWQNVSSIIVVTVGWKFARRNENGEKKKTGG